MTSFWSVLEFVKNLFWLIRHRPQYKDVIIAMTDIVNHGFICYDYDSILEMVKDDKEAYERLKESNICGSSA